MKLKSGHDVVPLADNEPKYLRENFVRLQPGGWFLTNKYPEIADQIYDFKFHPSDVVVSTYAKCGTTWMQEIVWTMLHNINFDNPFAKEKIITRSSFIEYDSISTPHLKEILPPYLTKLYPGINLKPSEPFILKLTKHLPEPRIIKTHLPFSLLPPNMLDVCKVIYVARNPMDVCVSYFHHCNLLAPTEFPVSFEQFVQDFMDDNLLHGPYWKCLEEAQSRRGHPNLHFVYYEDMKNDFQAELKKLSQFLKLNLSDEKLKEIAEYTDFRSMKKRDPFLGEYITSATYNKDIYKKDGGFFRRGQIGDWKSKFSGPLSDKMNAWIKENTISGIDFKYE